MYHTQAQLSNNVVGMPVKPESEITGQLNNLEDVIARVVILYDQLEAKLESVIQPRMPVAENKSGAVDPCPALQSSLAQRIQGSEIRLRHIASYLESLTMRVQL